MREIRHHQGVPHDNGVGCGRGLDNDSDPFTCGFEVTLTAGMNLDVDFIEKLLTRIGCRLYRGEARDTRIGQHVADHAGRCEFSGERVVRGGIVG